MKARTASSLRHEMREGLGRDSSAPWSAASAEELVPPAARGAPALSASRASSALLLLGNCVTPIALPMGCRVTMAASGWPASSWGISEPSQQGRAADASGMSRGCREREGHCSEITCNVKGVGPGTSCQTDAASGSSASRSRSARNREPPLAHDGSQIGVSRPPNSPTLVRRVSVTRRKARRGIHHACRSSSVFPQARCRRRGACACACSCLPRPCRRRPNARRPEPLLVQSA